MIRVKGFDAKTDEKSWQEDFKHENGNYCCICSVCGSDFIGHKRRVFCKKCAQKAKQ